MDTTDTPSAYRQSARIFKEISRLPNLLPQEEELRLLKIKDQDEEAFKKLIEHTLKSAVRFLQSLTDKLPIQELFSCAGMALMKATKNYDVSKATSGHHATLFTYAKPYLKREIVDAWKSREITSYGKNLPEKTLEFVSSEVYDDETLYEGVPTEDSEPETLCTSDGPDFDQIHANERMEAVRRQLSKLSETEYRVLVLQFDAGLSGEEIGKALGCTRSNIREARNRAIKKICNGLLRERKYLELLWAD